MMAAGPMIPEDRPHRLRTALRLVSGFALMAFVGLALAPSLVGEASGGDPIEPTSTPSIVVAAASANRSSQAASLSQVVETFEVFGGKNPFERPVLLPSIVDSTTTSTTSIPGTTTPDGATTTTTTQPGATTTTQPIEV